MLPKDDKLQPMLKDMLKIKDYMEGDVLPSPTLGFRTCTSMELWLDKGKPIMCNSVHDESQELLMTFPSSVQVNGKACKVDTLIDTGATHCFIDKSFVISRKWQMIPHGGEVTCAGDSIAEIHGCLKANLQIQGFSRSSEFLVMDLPSQNNT